MHGGIPQTPNITFTSREVFMHSVLWSATTRDTEGGFAYTRLFRSWLYTPKVNATQVEYLAFVTKIKSMTKTTQERSR